MGVDAQRASLRARLVTWCHAPSTLPAPHSCRFDSGAPLPGTPPYMLPRCGARTPVLEDMLQEAALACGDHWTSNYAEPLSSGAPCVATLHHGQCRYR